MLGFNTVLFFNGLAITAAIILVFTIPAVLITLSRRKKATEVPLPRDALTSQPDHTHIKKEKAATEPVLDDLEINGF